MRRFSAIQIVPALLMCIVTSVNAQVADSLERAIDEVVVAASHIDRQTIPAQELDAASIRRMSVSSVADALRYFNGIQIKDYGGIGGLKTVNVRSMGSEHVGVFLDGIQLGNAQNGMIDLGRYSLDNMESITMYNGQKSSIFQPAKSFASASTLYLQSRKPSFDEGKSHNFKAALKAGSFNTWNPSVLWERKIGENVSGSISAEYISTSGRYPFTITNKNGYDTTMVRANGDVAAIRVEPSLYGSGNGNVWNAKLYLYSSSRGYPGAVVRGDPEKSSATDRQWDTNLMLQGGWHRDFTGWYSVMAQAKYAYDYLHYNSDPSLTSGGMYVDNIYRQQEGYASLAQLFAINSWWSASLSADFQINSLDGNISDLNHPLRLTTLMAVSTAFGLRHLKGQASVLYTFVDDRNGKAVVDGTKNRLTPTVVLSWQPFESVDWNIRAFYKRVFRVPTLNDQYYTVVGGKPISPEYATQYNIGTTWGISQGSGALRSIDIQVDAYYNQIEDKIVAVPSSNQFRWTMMNVGYVEILGVDASVQSNVRIGQTSNGLSIKYTYQQAQDKTDNRSMWYGGQIPYVPAHSGSVSYSGDWRDWSWNYSMVYTGIRYVSVANIPENRVGQWCTHDVSASRHIKLNKCDLRATVEVNNIFNKQYEIVKCYPMPGISWRVRMEVWF